jgi:hypothetical protein
MSKIRITNDFEHLSDANLQVKASSIIDSLKDNPHFPDPKPDLAAVTEALEAFSNALTTAQAGNHADIAIKNQKREELLDKLRRLGEYVVFTAAGDTVKAASTNYSFARDYGGPVEISRPENLVVEDGDNSGDLRLRFNRVKGARSYVYQYTLDPISENSVWENKVGTVSQATFSNLQKGKRYWCRVGAVGNAETIFSEPVSRLVQ